MQQGTFTDRLRAILKVSAATLGAGRLSLWQLDEGGDTIRCESLCCLDPVTAMATAVYGGLDVPAFTGGREAEDDQAALAVGLR